MSDGFLTSFIEETLKGGEEQIKKELEDYWKMMDIYGKVLFRVTEGKMSKVGYTWEAIKEVLDEIDREKRE